MDPERCRRRRGGAGLLLLLLLPLLACGDGGAPDRSRSNGRPALPVEVVRAEPTSLPRTLSLVGALESPTSTTVAAEQRGKVVELDVPEGEIVEAGHVLVRQDPAPYRASLAVVRARLERARQRLERVRALHAQGVASDQQLDDAEADYEAAVGAVDEAETRVRDVTIRAPFAGRLGLREVDLGQYLAPGDPVVRITRTDPLELVFHVPQERAGEVALGQAVLGRAGRCGARFEARVTALDPVLDAGTRRRRVEARVANADGSLSPGMAARLRLVVGRFEDALLLPQEAIVRRGARHIVYVLGEDDRASPTEVELGDFFADGVHVRSGLEPGSRVVATGQQKLRPGAAVEPTPFEPTENPNVRRGWYGPTADCGLDGAEPAAGGS